MHNSLLKSIPPRCQIDVLTLCPARVHEVQGRGRHAFAQFQAARHPGQLIWILPSNEPQRPMPRGLPAGLAERLLILTPKGETDLLWSLEEALRSSPPSLVVAEPEKPLSLTAGRRLQLAAEAGRTTGLILVHEGQGSNAAETRWHCEARPSDESDSTLHEWALIKNKKGTIGSWILDWNGASAAFHLVSAAGERDQPAEPPR
jgi:protein ImuA